MACEDSCLRGNLVLSLMLWKCSGPDPGPERGLSRVGLMLWVQNSAQGPSMLFLCKQGLRWARLGLGM